ncbi:MULTISPECIES: AAA family ATPase [unclassified Sphingomonas]|uniref:AAA family ATPase n=1 Tax=unclassified Sphingomonas TaxID=196159 RepID=UPI0006FB832A|nr:MULTISPECIES: MoxR family ATPase [unclassified Sphingomonas]KQM61554.1 magnesium chelatase [Sphingomonas sp. Leaf16]KQN12650.1 magnesium chelatase [Sphingomonas sp. Leaf29]KQN19129.1 magnesium chelatase [Sphingomonas sp. Leaf32]
MTLDEVRSLGSAIDREISKAVVGQAGAVRLLTIALFSAGHVLLEGPPGTAKTLLAQSFARTLGLDFGRIQFTPDLMPGDIIGSNLFNFQTSEFALTRGPVFCELLLADEINRTPPKTQAALLEAMQERRITIDGRTEMLSDRFTVVATQNPIEQQGVYPLPEAQLDRFLFKIAIGWPDIDAERAIVAQYGTRTGTPAPQDSGVAQVAGSGAIAAAIDAVGQVRLVDEVIDYIVRLVRATREHGDLSSGASPRAASALAAASRAGAALDGRDYVIPDDVKTLAPALLRHRLILSPSAEIDGRRVDDVVASLIASVEAPR